MTERTVVVVTGATDGIGRETALELVRRGADVVAHGRSAEKLASVHAALEREAGRAQPAPVKAELGSLAEVRALAEALRQRPHPVDVLLNNAGIFAKREERTVDGFETTLGVNHLAPFLLTHLLLPRLRERVGSRVVNVSSMVHVRAQLTAAEAGGLMRFDGYDAYAASKLANVLFTVELSRRLGASAPTVNALHPGIVSTNLLRTGFGSGGSDSLPEGAATSVFLALSPSVAVTTGRYFVRSRDAAASPLAGDAQLAATFYEESARLVGVTALPG